MNEQCTLEEMIDKFDVQACADGRFSARPLNGGRGAVDASQILAQAVVAAAKQVPGKSVKSIHMIFARVATDKEDLQLEVEVIHSGRSFASVTVTAWQGSKLCARGLVLMDSNESDLIRHQQKMPEVAGPEESHLLAMPVTGRELRVVEQVDLMDPDDVGPPELNVWLKYAQAPQQESLNNALLAHLSNHFSIATAMRPHEGISQSMAHRTLSCGVLSLTFHFHEPATKADQWLLYAHKSVSAGRGLSQCQADIFSQNGRLVASFTQENMIRSLSTAVDPGLKRSGTVL